MTPQEKALYHQIHPLKLLTDICAEVVSLYLFWKRKLLAGFVVLLVPPIIASTLIVKWVDLEAYKQSAFAHEVRNEIDFGQASDFWNQNGQDECILLCRYARLSDEASQRSGIICGRDSRPHHPCDVRSATSRRTRSSSCWQDLEVSTFATPV